MGRSRATTWLIAILLVVLGGMGFVRDLHAASHSIENLAVAACEHELTDTAPASMPLDGDRHEDDCPTCDLLAVLNKSVAITSVQVAVDRAVLVRVFNAPAAADPVVADRLDANRTRGPPLA